MKIQIIILCFFSYLATGYITFLITHHFQIGNPQLGFIVGASVGSSLGSVMHFNQQNSINNLKIKFILGLSLSLASITLSLLLHYIHSPFKFLDVTLVICAIGSLVFPLAIFNTMWTAMEKKKAGAKE